MPKIGFAEGKVNSGSPFLRLRLAGSDARDENPARSAMRTRPAIEASVAAIRLWLLKTWSARTETPRAVPDGLRRQADDADHVRVFFDSGDYSLATATSGASDLPG